MWWLWPIYVVLLMGIVYISIKLAKYIDILDKKTKLSGAFLGGILLAGVTSLPELVTSLSAVLLMDEPGMTQGNILGSNLFNVTIIGVLFFCYLTRIRKQNVGKTNGVFILVYLIFIAIMFTFTVLDIQVIIPYVNINILTPIAIIIYVISVIATGKNGEVAKEDLDGIPAGMDRKLSVKQAAWLFVLFSLLLIGVSIALTYTAEKLADIYSLGKGLAGALFLGVATSLPEIISTFELTRLGNFDTALGNILGSCLFNFLVLSIADIFYFKGTVFINDMQSIYLGGFLLLSLVTLGIFYMFKYKKIRQKSPLLYIIPGLIIVASYVTFLVLSAQI